MSLLGDTWTITKKEIRLFIKQPVFGISRSLLFPLIWIIFFAYGFGGTLHSLPIAVVDDSHGTYSQQLINGLATGDTFKITFTSYSDALQGFKDKDYAAVVYIPSELNDAVKSNSIAKVYLLLDSSNPTVATAVTGKVQSTTQQVSQNIAIAGPGSVTLDQQTFYGRGIRYLDFLAPGIIMQTLVFSAMFSGGISLLMDKELGTLKLLMLAPISRESIILGKTLGGVIQALISGFASLTIILLLGVHVQYNIWLFLLVPLIMVLISFAFIGMTTIIATRVKRFEEFVMITQTLILPLWFVSGSIYPIYSMPDWMQMIARINPLTYAVDALRSIMIRGVIFQSIVLDISILLAFSTIMFIIGVLSFRRTVE